jgi:hypothetical protein
VAIDLTPREETAERYIDEVEHPAARGGRPGTVSAARVVVLVVVALVTASMLNSEGLVRAGESMQPGVTRTLTLAVAHPVDDVAQRLGLSLPEHALTTALGHEDLSGGEIVDDAAPAIQVPPDRSGHLAAINPEPPAPPSRLHPPTTSHPLKVLVTGDSLSTYVGLQMTNLTQDSGLVDVSLIDRNGTGLSNPSFFNWQKAARTDVAKRDPDAVFMIIGGNDGWPMQTPSGDRVQVGSDAWVQEYARRTAAVMRTYGEGGRAVYWSGPPTARSASWNGIYRKINRAVAAAADAIPGATYVDLYDGTAVDGKYADVVRDGGKRVKARQSDGVHWTLAGSRLPAELLLGQLEGDVEVALH